MYNFGYTNLIFNKPFPYINEKSKMYICICICMNVSVLSEEDHQISIMFILDVFSNIQFLFKIISLEK